MAYYLNLFSPATYEAFSKSDRGVSGFSSSQRSAATRLAVGDKLVCYMTKLSRWVGVLEVLSAPFEDSTPIFYESDDPFVIRFRVRADVWLPKELAVPIRSPEMWDALSFTKDLEPGSGRWTGTLRRSLNRLDDTDGRHIVSVLERQLAGGVEYPVDQREYDKLVTTRVRREDKLVAVSVPDNDAPQTESPGLTPDTPRESSEIQALIARTGEKMGFKVWLPKQDRGAVTSHWNPRDKTLLEVLPLNYDTATLKTIEQIDVIWLRGRSIVRAFEIEHTTSVYSGILRMADLMALQPNMEIKLHIVAPEERKAKVFSEISRPVFTLLEKGPLHEHCTFLSYDSIRELSRTKYLAHLSDSVIEDFAEMVSE
jgi:hypothetical protein